MNVPAMSLELHERGIHAVWTGGPGPRPGGTGVTGARQDPPAPQTPRPRNTRCVRTPQVPERRIAARARRRPGPRSGLGEDTAASTDRSPRYSARTIYHIEAPRLYPVKR